MRLAKATIARFAPRRLATCAAQLLSHVERPPCIITVAADTKLFADWRRQLA